MSRLPEQPVRMHGYIASISLSIALTKQMEEESLTLEAKVDVIRANEFLKTEMQKPD